MKLFFIYFLFLSSLNVAQAKENEKIPGLKEGKLYGAEIKDASEICLLASCFGPKNKYVLELAEKFPAQGGPKSILISESDIKSGKIETFIIALQQMTQAEIEGKIQLILIDKNNNSFEKEYDIYDAVYEDENGNKFYIYIDFSDIYSPYHPYSFDDEMQTKHTAFVSTKPNYAGLYNVLRGSHVVDLEEDLKKLAKDVMANITNQGGRGQQSQENSEGKAQNSGGRTGQQGPIDPAEQTVENEDLAEAPTITKEEWAGHLKKVEENEAESQNNTDPSQIHLQSADERL